MLERRLNCDNGFTVAETAGDGSSVLEGIVDAASAEGKMVSNDR